MFNPCFFTGSLMKAVIWNNSDLARLSLLLLWNYLWRHHGVLVHVHMEKPGISVDLKRIPKMAGNYFPLCDRSQDKTPWVASDGNSENKECLFREQTYVCSRLSFLESRGPGGEKMALKGSKFSVPGSFRWSADSCLCEHRRHFSIWWHCQSTAPWSWH